MKSNGAPSPAMAQPMRRKPSSMRPICPHKPRKPKVLTIAVPFIAPTAAPSERDPLRGGRHIGVPRRHHRADHVREPRPRSPAGDFADKRRIAGAAREVGAPDEALAGFDMPAPIEPGECKGLLDHGEKAVGLAGCDDEI